MSEQFETMDQADLVTEFISHEHASDLGAAVERLFNECLFKTDEIVNGTPTSDPVIAEGITCNVGFHASRLEAAKPKIRAFIAQMDDAFLESKGGGMSFLNLCNDRDGKQWANLHRTMEQLVQLAIGCGLGGYCVPREMWSVFPGSMPYVWFDDRTTKDE